MNAELFFARMSEYNQAIFPMQIVVYLFTLLFLASTFRNFRYARQINVVFIAFIWGWNGIVQQVIFFSQYNVQYYFWGIVFFLQAILFLWYDGFRNKLIFEFKKNTYSYLGLLFISYALVIYPVIGAMVGHPYPRGPIFGVAPCPTVIFTFGSVLLVHKRIHAYVLFFPLLWAIMSLYPVFQLGVWADLGETIIGIVTFILVLIRNKKIRVQHISS